MLTKFQTGGCRALCNGREEDTSLCALPLVFKTPNQNHKRTTSDIQTGGRKNQHHKITGTSRLGSQWPALNACLLRFYTFSAHFFPHPTWASRILHSRTFVRPKFAPLHPTTPPSQSPYATIAHGYTPSRPCSSSLLSMFAVVRLAEVRAFVNHLRIAENPFRVASAVYVSESKSRPWLRHTRSYPRCPFCLGSERQQRRELLRIIF